ncbi:MAG: hypothetical protein HY521_10995 [Proteobacteria bacterium]|nr:hypothetical protein [Pseudomonadota bacterium]
MDPLALTARQAVRAFADGALTAESYARALLARSRALSRLNAFIWQEPETVLEWARAADKRRARGERLGPLAGLPLAIKDNIEVEGLATTAGSPLLRNFVARSTAPVVERLWAAGAFLLGKTNMHELAMGPTSINRAFGAVGNPYAPDRIAGGSSGGTAAAVAGRMAPAGIGTDTGGSVRGPSALCGLVGLRPTVGRYSADGIVPLSHTRDVAGPMARDVADAVLLDGVMADEPTELAPAPLKGLRLGVPRRYYYENLNPEVARLMEEELGRVKGLGVTLVEADFRRDDIARNEVGFAITRFETMTDLPAFLAARGLKLTMREIADGIATPVVKGHVEDQLSPRGFTDRDYRRAMEVERPRWLAAFESYLRENDVAAIAFPTLRLPAHTIAEEISVMHNGREYPPQVINNMNVGPGSILGLPGLTLPVGLTAAGLPVGMELDSMRDRDRDLLAIGLALQGDRPPLPPPAI